MGIKPNSENNSSTGGDNRLKSGREGLMGWLNPTRYGWQRVAYLLQRLTGVFLLIYFVGHIY
jgi:succinate dehydrogenase / fumarate reductase cytochrome b subunit